MTGYQIVSRLSLITYAFGALTFSVLALLYWRERRSRRQRDAGAVLPAFTAVCAVSFLLNLAPRWDGPWGSVLIVLQDLVTGAVPPLLAHLVFREEAPGLSRRRWMRALAGFYAVCVAIGLAQGLSDADLAAADWSDGLEGARAVLLGATGVFGLACQAWSRRDLSPDDRRYRAWNRALLVLLVLCAGLNLAFPSAVLGLLPDYLVLGFFCVALYHRERLVLFDVLIKRGVFLALGLVCLAVFEPWPTALLLTPLWLAAPWIYGRIARAIDRGWLHRQYSGADAERKFLRDIQAAASEADLLARSQRSLAEIFHTRAMVAGDGAAVTADARGDSLVAVLELSGGAGGWVRLEPRPDGIPFLTDDRRLLQSVARALAVVLENVRFRDREQQLRLLATRAELKALRAQINPHFLFNALNAIAGLIAEQPRVAEETVEQLAEVFRYTLRKSENEWVRLDEEVEFVRSYLQVEQARFGARLKVEIEVDAAAEASPIPAMSVQPLVENAIKHGASAVEGQGWVRVRASLHAGLLRIEICDNGPGFPAGAPSGAVSGHGLRNIAERLRGYYGGLARLGWEHTEGGTRVYMELPATPVPAVDNSGGGEPR